MNSRTRFDWKYLRNARAGYWTKVQWHRSERSPDTADNNERPKAMKPRESRTSYRLLLSSMLAVSCSAVVLSLGQPLAIAQQAQSPATTAPAAEEAPKISNAQLDSLVAPIALFPDQLLAQTLAASTYPLEMIQLQQWMDKNKNLKDKALSDAVAKQPWDPSVQAMAAFPDVIQRLAGNIQWTTDLGNAFLAQQSDVMDAVQRMRAKAEGKGTLKTSAQQKVESKTEGGKDVIVIEQADPQVVYVPSYDPVVVYGEPEYPYYPYEYPPAGYYAAGMAISFGLGIAMGAAWGGGWGWGAVWGNNQININNNNNFNRNTNINGGNRNNINGGDRNNIGGGNRGGDAGWKHNPQHRGGAPYRDQATADRFGGTTRGDSLANRQATARDQVGRQGGNLASNRAEGIGGGNRAGNGAGDGIGSGNRPSGAGADRIGGRDVSRSGGGNRAAFDGGSGGYNGSSARSSSSRGSSSMGSRGGGGSGGGRGGGGRRR